MPADRIHRLKPSPRSPGSMRGVLDKLSQAIAAHQSRLDDLVAQHFAARDAQARARHELDDALRAIKVRLERLEARAEGGPPAN